MTINELHRAKVYKVQHANFSKMFNLPTEPPHEFPKDILTTIINTQLGQPVTYNKVTLPVTFGMIYLANLILDHE